MVRSSPDDDNPRHASWIKPDGRRQAFIKIPTPRYMHGVWAHFHSEAPDHRKAFEQWRNEAAWMIRSQAIRPFRGHALVELRCQLLDGAGEIEDRIAPVMTLLRDLEILPADSKVVQVSARWFVPRRGGGLVVLTEPKPSWIEKATRRIKRGKETKC